MKLVRTDFTNNDFRYLVILLDNDLKLRDGDENKFYDTFNKIQNINNVIVCYENDKPIGCGAFKKYDGSIVEIKRMFVDPQYRGLGIGYEILNQLELWAVENKFSECILETGKRQKEALNLYKKAGYIIIGNYGQYVGVANSVCFSKKLVKKSAVTFVK